MQKALNGICFIHATDPCAKARIRQPVSKATDGIGHHKSRIGRVRCENSIGDDVAEGSHDGDTATAKGYVDTGIGECCEGVACERGEEYEGNDSVV